MIIDGDAFDKLEAKGSSGKSMLFWLEQFWSKFFVVVFVVDASSKWAQFVVASFDEIDNEPNDFANGSSVELNCDWNKIKINN